MVFGCVCWGVVFIVEGVKGFYGFGGWVLMVRWGLLVVGVVVLAAGCVGDGSSGVPAVTSVLPSESSATASTAAAGGLGGSEVVGGSSTTLGVVGVEEVQVDDSSFGEPGGLVVEDGSDSVEPSDGAGVGGAGGEVEVPSAIVAGTVTEDEPVAPVRVVAEVWRYGLGEKAFDLINPRLVGSDLWKPVLERENYGQKRYHVFYWFHDPEGDTDQEVTGFNDALKIARLGKFELGDTIYLPVRYDLQWEEHPDVVSVTAYFPLGENRRVRVRSNGGSWALGDAVFVLSNSTDVGTDQVIPKGPPMPLTTPFAEPRWADTSVALGRDCPPVEAIWAGNGHLITDQCTLDAINTALQMAWREPSELRQRAIRDGHVLGDLFHRLDNQANPYLAAYTGEFSRAQSTVEVRNMKWAGNWPGASMVYLEFRIVHPDRKPTEEERQGGIRYLAGVIARGSDISPEKARGDFTMGFAWRWESALMVRTSDGTWRMSYRSFCRWYQVFTTTEQPGFLCPDDPTPHFPDSDLYDKNLYPPNHPRYYTDPRKKVDEHPIHDGGSPRDNTEYVGVPPS